MISLGMQALFIAQASILAKVNDQGGQLRGVYVLSPVSGAKDPLVVIVKRDQDGMETLDGSGGFQASEIDVECHAPSAAKMVSLASAVDDFFRNYSGAAGDVTIDAVIKQDESDELEDYGDSSNVVTHIRILTYLVQWR